MSARRPLKTWPPGSAVFFIDDCDMYVEGMGPTGCEGCGCVTSETDELSGEDVWWVEPDETLRPLTPGARAMLALVRR